MINTLQEFFTRKLTSRAGQKEASTDDQDLQIAAATLMFEVIRSDGKVLRTELIAMGEILRDLFNFDDDDIETLVSLAHQSSLEATCLQGFTRSICDKWGNSKRARLLEYLWMISLTDKHIDANERHLVRKVAGLLYLNESQIAQSKEKAKIKLGINEFAS